MSVNLVLNFRKSRKLSVHVRKTCFALTDEKLFKFSHFDWGDHHDVVVRPIIWLSFRFLPKYVITPRYLVYKVSLTCGQTEGF